VLALKTLVSNPSVPAAVSTSFKVSTAVSELAGLGAGLVASLARPGGNVTGLSVQSTDSAVKKLELLHEVVPRLRRLAIMGNVGFNQVVLEMGEVHAAARTLGIEMAPLDIRRAEEIAPAFDALKTQADALHVVGDELIGAEALRDRGCDESSADRRRLYPMRGRRPAPRIFVAVQESGPGPTPPSPLVLGHGTF
jgi:putative ABC transport system substrate-binding protein